MVYNLTKYHHLAFEIGHWSFKAPIIIKPAINYTKPSCRTPIRHPGKSGIDGDSRHYLFGVFSWQVNIEMADIDFFMR